MCWCGNSAVGKHGVRRPGRVNPVRLWESSLPIDNACDAKGRGRRRGRNSGPFRHVESKSQSDQSLIGLS